jgi:aryl-alcohol dehydrogenase-like predicted oxidoreductase
MKTHPLGNTTFHVPEICLGTMTFGQQNTEAEAHEQLSYAVAHGVNFLDTAEMYPVPPKAETFTRCETIIGHWLKNQARDKVILATKVAGYSRGMNWIRGGGDATKENILSAADASLQRLQTNYIDLYQLHWPSRNVPLFGAREFDPKNERSSASIAEQVTAFGALIKAGKIRHYGLSNETPWGIQAWCAEADRQGVARPVTVQNAYNLVNRAFDDGVAEVSFREKVGLLAYSPLAFGQLSAKYVDNPNAKGRITEFGPNWSPRYCRSETLAACAEYAKLARAHSLTPATLAIAWCASRWYMTSAIIGATNLAQLKENIAAFDVTLSAEIIEAVNAIHKKITNPAL